jgi:hypothetical protein
MRRALILVALAASAGTQHGDIRDRVIAFETHHDKFVRKLFGCPSRGDVSVETCKPVRGEIDYSAFRKAREAAKALYGLNE